MKYINTLQQEITAQLSRVAELEEQIEEVVRYLALPKFEQETWVSKYDILRLLGKY